VKKVKRNKSKIDVKYLDIPNICFSLTKETDSRESRFKKQRIKRGFDDSETWSLTDSIINFSLPRLKRYRKIIDKSISNKEYKKQVDRVIVSFKLLSRNNGSRLFTEKEKKKVLKGLKEFNSIFLDLWW
jgi:hypothetical protein